VNTNALKKPATECVFCAWVEDWEKDIRTKMILLQRHACSTSIKVLSFLDPDCKETFSIYEDNMEFCRGNENGWFVIAVCAMEDEVFKLELACELIGDMEQKSGVKVIHPNGDV
jgi:hypothetical protein